LDIYKQVTVTFMRKKSSPLS